MRQLEKLTWPRIAFQGKLNLEHLQYFIAFRLNVKLNAGDGEGACNGSY